MGHRLVHAPAVLHSTLTTMVGCLLIMLPKQLNLCPSRVDASFVHSHAELACNEHASTHPQAKHMLPNDGKAVMTYSTWSIPVSPFSGMLVHVGIYLSQL